MKGCLVQPFNRKISLAGVVAEAKDGGAWGECGEVGGDGGEGCSAAHSYQNAFFAGGALGVFKGFFLAYRNASVKDGGVQVAGEEAGGDALDFVRRMGSAGDE